VRGFIAFTLLALVGLAALVFFVAPAVVSPLVVNAVRAAVPFGDQPLQIDVTTSGPSLLSGRVDAIHVAGRKLVTTGLNEGVTIGALDVTVSRVKIGDHAFDAVTGGLDDVGIPMPDGDTLAIGHVGFTGGSTAVTGSAQFSSAEAIAFLRRALADQGVAVEDVALEDGGVSLVVFGQRVSLALGVQDGALEIPDALGAGPMTLVEPGPDDRWRLTGVAITPDGMEIDVVVDADALLARG
jgi:hypothetical protein